MKGECYYLWKAKKESVFFKNTCRYGLSSVGLLLTLVLIFAFQGNTILENPLHIVLIAVPLVLQTFFVFAIVYSKEKLISTILLSVRWRASCAMSAASAVSKSSRLCIPRRSRSVRWRICRSVAASTVFVRRGRANAWYDAIFPVQRLLFRPSRD